MLKRLCWQSLTSLMLILFCSLSAFSCTCSEINYRREFAKAKAIFIGEALEYRDNPNVKEDGLLIVKFKVEKSWKGVKQPEIILPTHFSQVCGFYIEPGKRYLIYAYGKKMIVPTTCSPSTQMSVNEEYNSKQIKQLNSGWFRFFSRIFPFYF